MAFLGIHNRVSTNGEALTLVFLFITGAIFIWSQFIHPYSWGVTHPFWYVSHGLFAAAFGAGVASLLGHAGRSRLSNIWLARLSITYFLGAVVLFSFSCATATATMHNQDSVHLTIVIVFVIWWLVFAGVFRATKQVSQSTKSY